MKSIDDQIERLMAPDVPEEITWARTGCLLLDLVVGGGEGLGFPFGRIVNLVGDKSSGKTFLANEIIASSYHRMGEENLAWNFDDGENGYTFDSRTMYGMDIKDENALTSKLVEDFDVNHRRFIRDLDDRKGIYVLDSLDGLSDADKEDRGEKRLKAADKGESFEKGTYGMATPKFLSQEFFRTQTSACEEARSLLIIVSQVREDINPRSFTKFKRSGGKALDFYAHTALWLATVKKIEKAGRISGVVVKARTDKSKTPRPFRECVFTLYFDHGIDDIGSSLDFLFDLRNDDGKLNSGATVINWDDPAEGGDVVAKNRTSVKKFLTENGIQKQVLDAREEAEGKRSLNMAFSENWCMENGWADKWVEKFGSSMTRTELRAKIAGDPAMYEELNRRVISKWEDIEEKSRSGLGSKYG